jgi:cytochrome c oxidase subunit 1
VEATTAGVYHPRAAEFAVEPRLTARRVGWLCLGTGSLLFAVMGLAGLVMRLHQAEVIDISSSWFYRLMTLHGAGMLTAGLVAMMGALWLVLRGEVPLDLARMAASFLAILLGAVLVVVAVLVGGFAAGWTFLTPLPFYAFGEWSTWATVVFLVGLLLVGAGFVVYCVDVLTKLTDTYGGLTRALGIDFLRGRDESPPPPPALAGIVIALEGLLASAVGTTVLVALLARTIDEGATLDALWAKNLTYFFGHSIANLIIYIGVGALYAFLPRYAGRPWKTTKPLAVAWLATLAIVAVAYSHHLYMDFVQPGALQVISSVASFAAAIPVAVVTIFTAVVLVWGSRYRWTLASTLLYVGFAGWAIGGTGAVIDSLIPVNFRFHNTLWVPAHFHTYLLLAVIVWALAFLAHLLERAAERPASRARSALAVGLMLVGGYGFVAAWYVAGALGVPRRYAVHPPGTEGYSLAGSIFTMVFALGFLVLLAEFVALARVARARRRREALEPAVEADEPPPAAARPSGRVLASGPQLGVAVAAAVIAAVSFFPQVTDAAEGSAQYHHLQHAGQFLFGALVGLVLASFPGLARMRSDVALAVSIVAPAAMLLMMVPSVYESLEEPGLHALYHLAVLAPGLATGLAVAALGRVTGRLLLVLSVGMGLMYAAGVGG